MAAGPQAFKAHSAVNWLTDEWTIVETGALSVPVQAPMEASVVDLAWFDQETPKGHHRGHGFIWIQSRSTHTPEWGHIHWEKAKRIRVQPSSYSSSKSWWCFVAFWHTMKVVFPARAIPLNRWQRSGEYQQRFGSEAFADVGTGKWGMTPTLLNGFHEETAIYCFVIYFFSLTYLWYFPKGNVVGNYGDLQGKAIAGKPKAKSVPIWRCMTNQTVAALY